MLKLSPVFLSRSCLWMHRNPVTNFHGRETSLCKKFYLFFFFKCRVRRICIKVVLCASFANNLANQSLCHCITQFLKLKFWVFLHLDDAVSHRV